MCDTNGTVGPAHLHSAFLSFFLQDSDMLACHNYWHWALYLIEKVGYLALWLVSPSADVQRRALAPTMCLISMQHLCVLVQKMVS